MRTKTGFSLAAITLFLITTILLFAGGYSGDKEKFAKLKAELNLTDAQVAQLQERMEALRPSGEQAEQKVKAAKQQVEELEQASPRDEKAIDAKRYEIERTMKDWKERMTAVYRSVLTDEQYARFERMKYKGEKEGHEGKEKKEREYKDKRL